MQPSTTIVRSGRLLALHALALVSSAGAAVAGGFGIEQSAYYQGMSFAGAAAGGPSLASLAWNPATANFAGPDLAFEPAIL